jgi:hypothetical protein
METKRDLELDGGTCVPSCEAHERERVDPAGDDGCVVGPGPWGWDRIELRSAGWQSFGELKHCASQGCAYYQREAVLTTTGSGPTGSGEPVGSGGSR